MDGGIRKFISYRFGGLFPKGDLSQIPAGKTPDCENVVFKPGGRMEARPGFKSDHPGVNTTAYALAKWFNPSTGEDELIYSTVSEFWQRTLGGSWSLAATANGGIGQRNPFNLEGMLIALYGGSQAAGYPIITIHGGSSSSSLYATLRQDYSGLRGRCGAAFLERIFLGSTILYISNLLYADPYVQGSGWTLSGCSRFTETIGTSSVSYVVPSGSTGTRYFMSTSAIANVYDDRSVVTGRAALRNRSKTTNLPMTIKILVGNAVARSTAYTVGDVARPTTSNTYAYRCTAAGTTAVGEPVWPTTVGATVSDGTATWTCIGSEVLSSTEVNLPPGTDESGFYVVYLSPAVVTVGSGGITPTFIAQYVFGNTSYTTWPVDGVDVGLADAYSDGDPRKNNEGQQITNGVFKYPYANVGTFTLPTPQTGTIYENDTIRWSEFLSNSYGAKTFRFRASGFWKLTEHPGYITAIAKLSDRLVATKLNATWIFSGSADPNLPLQMEGAFTGVGCLGPLAFGYFENDLIMLGEDDIYRVSGNGPAPLLNGDEWNAMREVIFARGADWVENQSNPYNVPRLTIDPSTKRMYVYTQKGVIFVFDFVSNEWTKFRIKTTGGVDTEVASMVHFDGKLWLSLSGSQVGYLDENTTKDEVYNANPVDIEYYWDFPVTEMAGPKRDLLVESIDLHHQITVASPTVKVQISRDGGATFPQYNEVTLTQSPASSVTKTDRIDIVQMSDSLRVRIGNVGEGGPANFSVVRAEMAVQALSGDDNMEYPVTTTDGNL